MTLLRTVVVAVAVLALPLTIRAQATNTDVYHVIFAKAAPGQAADTSAKNLQEQDPKDPMAGHFLMLRHQEGDDWDYAVISHLGQKATVTVTPVPPSALGSDSGVAQRCVCLGTVVGRILKTHDGARDVDLHRGCPSRGARAPRAVVRGAHAERDPSMKVPLSQVALTHLEGGSWQYLVIARYNSWQDLGADRAAAAASEKGWFEIRQHSAWHVDTIADRVGAKWYTGAGREAPAWW